MCNWLEQGVVIGIVQWVWCFLCGVQDVLWIEVEVVYYVLDVVFEILVCLYFVFYQWEVGCFDWVFEIDEDVGFCLFVDFCVIEFVWLQYLMYVDDLVGCIDVGCDCDFVYWLGWLYQVFVVVGQVVDFVWWVYVCDDC